MIARKTNSPRGIARPAQRASRPVTSTTGRDNLNHSPAREGLIAAERGNPVLHDLANKPSARILIETEVGGVAALFIFQPFHLAELSDA